MEKNYTYLALGDSYTIGESLPLIKSFPYQVVSKLREKGLSFTAPEIIAKTGWTTDELLQALEGYPFLVKYDFVTLLIGVNNQYRHRMVEEYKLELETLINKALVLSDHKKEHVLLLSIPDYSVTPFGKKMEPEKIARELEVFNSVKKALSLQYKIKHIDITRGSRDAAVDETLLADDGLHPSEKEYSRWAEEVVRQITAQIK